MLKNIVLMLGCVCFTSTLSAYAPSVGTNVHKDNFAYYARLEGDKILSDKGISIYTYSYAIKQKYEDSLASAVNRLNSICWVQGNLLVDLVKVKDITDEEVNSFVKFTQTLVLSNQLDYEVNSAVCDLLHKNNLVKDDVFAKAEIEYNSRYNNAKNKLNKLMVNEYRDYVTKQEIEKTVKEEFIVLVARMKQAKAKEVLATQSTGGNLIDWILGTGAYATSSTSQPKPQPVTYYAYDKIYKSQLDQQVVLIANNVLQEKGYHQDSLPARVISDYSDAVQKIILDAKARMNNYAYEYLSSNDIKNIAKTYLQAVFDKIKFKGETCSICLDDFSAGQEVGFLLCGHFFHGDCIRQALKQSGEKCPLCRKYADKIDHTEYVPWQ